MNTYYIRNILLIGSLILLQGFSIVEKLTVVTKTKLIRSNEFNIAGLPNSSFWSIYPKIGNNRLENNQLQYYATRLENMVVENGTLNSYISYYLENVAYNQITLEEWVFNQSFYTVLNRTVGRNLPVFPNAKIFSSNNVSGLR